MSVPPPAHPQDEPFELMEELAAIEHERWADWQAWCHKILRENCPSSKLEAVLERWDKQIAKSYKELSEQEKESDREQVRRYLPLLRAYVDRQRADELKRLMEFHTFDLKPFITSRLAQLGGADSQEQEANNH